VAVPVAVLHGARDASVPYMEAIRLMEVLEGEQVEVVVRKAAEHRFSEEASRGEESSVDG